ncbi:hypothetical protein [Parasegetibacter sp. NRK P23]|uniref:hypothetical protein n=1 Tax=Parasegetibacter sp. NRK P23 TaxID=2942999 RepID=UPI002044AD7F|nr:hypothetical protein [Parasegetibacter sp. NRK P23]MCM5529553.1 hypothetical protein [Parasegetibacter sp. NRK P23]
MKKVFLAAVAGMFALTSCVKVEFNENNGSGGGTSTDDPNVTKILTGTYDRSITLAKGTYTLKGYVYVNNGAVVTIAPGSIIKSDITEKGALIVERGSRLIADGSPTEPIIFTSGKASGQRQPGDWGGIILLGKATTNRPTSPAPIIEGGVNRPYGGTEAEDNSGILRYVRIEFAGIAAEPGSEINGLTLGGVGSKTIIENVQVSYGNDDAYEFFGGTVNCKNLVAFATADDDFDFDFGYTGKIQFAVSLRDKFADTDAANGIEADNDGSGTAATPFTRPVLSNFTFIGPYDTTGSAATHNYSNRWRRAVRFAVHNSILLGHRKGGFSIESAATWNAFYTDNNSSFKNNIIAVYANPVLADSSASRAFTGAKYGANPLSSSDRSAMIAETVAAMRTKVEGEGNTILAKREDVMLTSPFMLNAPNFIPASGSPALSGASFTGLDAYFSATTYRGAFGTTNWLTGWASFTPQTNNY